MTNIQRLFKSWIRFIAWMGAWMLETATVWERMSQKVDPVPVSILLWLIVIATWFVGIFDIKSFNEKLRQPKRKAR